MTQPQPAKKRKKPLGPALVWSDADLEHLSQVSDIDKKAALVMWRNEAPARFKTLLQAGATKEGHA